MYTVIACLQNTENPFEFNNPLAYYFDRRIDYFSYDPPPLRVFLVWGLKEQDKDDCHWSDVDCDGDTRYDRKFNLNDPGTQQALLVRSTFVWYVHQ